MTQRDPAGAAEVAAFFDAHAGRWEREHGPDSPRAAGFRAVAEFLRRMAAELPAPPALLDIGCATGAHLRALGPGLRLGVGVDLSPGMIAAARAASAGAGGAPLRFEVADVAGLRAALAAAAAIPEGGFDLITMIGTLEHVPDRTRALAEAAALLSPRTGRLVVIAPHRWSAPLLRRRLRQGGGAPRFCAADRHFGLRDLARMARAAGLLVERSAAIDAPAWPGEPAPGRLWLALERARRRLAPLRRLGVFAAVLRAADPAPVGPPIGPPAGPPVEPQPGDRA